MQHTANPAPDDLVTSSDLVRRFGVWQERAGRRPVYILHRGRPRFVLTSIEVMDALCAPHADSTDASGTDLAGVLNGVDDLVVLADAELRVTAASRAACVHFGTLANRGEPLDALAPLAARSFFADAIARVMEAGTSDRIDIPSPSRPGRLLSMTLEPMSEGIALFARDQSTERDYRAALAQQRALAEATATISGVATARINLRGYVAEPDATLATATGLSREALAMVRFVALVDISARARLGETIEAVIAGGCARVLGATLLVNRAAPRRVQIGLAALRNGFAIDGVAAMIVPDAAP